MNCAEKLSEPNSTRDSIKYISRVQVSLQILSLKVNFANNMI